MPDLGLKLARAALTVWIAVSFVFVLMRISGDPALQILGADMPAETLALFRSEMGLDLPIWQQYLQYLSNVVQGDFGTSFQNGQPAMQVVLSVLPKTLLLMSVGFALALAIGVPAGVLAALHRDGPVDKLVMVAAMIGFATPNFLFAILLLLLFSMTLRVLPAGGSGTALHLIMPAVTIGTYYAAMLARFVRNAMIESLETAFMPAALARGMSYRRAVRRHAFPNAALPTVTLGGLIIGGLISGATVTETVFAWPGMGRLLVNAVGARDLPVVQFIILLLVAAMVCVNLLVDLSYGYLDPRLRRKGT